MLQVDWLADCNTLHCSQQGKSVYAMSGSLTSDIWHCTVMSWILWILWMLWWLHPVIHPYPTDNNTISLCHADNNIIIFQVQLGFPQFPVPGIFYSATFQPDHGVRYLVQGKLNNPRVVAIICENILSAFVCRHWGLHQLQPVDIVSTKCPPHKFLNTITHGSANFLLSCQVGHWQFSLTDRLSFIWFIFISTCHFQMVLSPSQPLHTGPRHLHCDAHHFPPHRHHQPLHPPHLHPGLHDDGAVPDLLLRDVVPAAHPVLWSSSSRHGETVRLLVTLRDFELLLLISQSSSGVFVCLLESLHHLWTVDPRLLSIYYLIFVLAAYLASFDLHYALPVMVS